MKTRIIKTEMHFEDEWFNTLSLGYRYLFIYLFTNIHIGHTGAYKLPDRVAMLETGTTKEEWTKAINKFEKDKKIMRFGEYIYIVNSQKHTNYSGPKNAEAYKKEFLSLPKLIQDTISIQYGYSMHTPINQKPEIINDKSKTENYKSVEDVKSEIRRNLKKF